jgi:hypothetical protein
MRAGNALLCRKRRAHEMAHMCGIGPDVRDAVNRKKANDIGLACGGAE